MTRLYVLVEGQTEEEFVKALLAPHLRQVGIWVYTLVVETSRDATGRKRRGGGRWRHWLRDLKRLTSEQSGQDARFTTMFDLYGLPEDFPELDRHRGDQDTTRRADNLAAAMARAVNDHRLVPHLQRHEFESLVLASLDALATVLGDAAAREGIDALRATMQDAAPEDVDDGIATAPSRRLLSHLPRYRKTVHGPVALERAGLAALRAKCPYFDAWIKQLEALGQGAP